MLLTQEINISALNVGKTLPRPMNIVMAGPDYFDVLSVKNPHMQGNVGNVDYAKAITQWEALRKTFIDLGLNVLVMKGEPGLEDFVFTANHGLVFLDQDEKKKVIPALMSAQNRQGEVPHFVAFMKKQGYQVVDCFDEEDQFFEGMGDALWHQKYKILLAGYGFRTSLKGLQKITDCMQIPVVALELVDSRCYHLDTCLSILDEQTVMIFPDAFTEQGLRLIQALFPRVLSVNEDEATLKLACNSLCIDKRHVVLQAGCSKTNRMLEKEGFIPVGVDTSEFLKSGGSTACLQLRFW